MSISYTCILLKPFFFIFKYTVLSFGVKKSVLIDQLLDLSDHTQHQMIKVMVTMSKEFCHLF